MCQIWLKYLLFPRVRPTFVADVQLMTSPRLQFLVTRSIPMAVMHLPAKCCRQKSVEFLSVCLFFVLFYLSCFRITKFVITEKLLSNIIFKTIMAPLHRGTFVVVQLPVFLAIPVFSLKCKFIPKTRNPYESYHFWQFLGP